MTNNQWNLCSPILDSLSYFHGALLAPSIPASGFGYTWAFLQAAAAEITPLSPQEKALCPARSKPCSSSLRGLMDVSSGAERARLTGVVSGLQGWFLPWPESGGTARGLSLGAEWRRRHQGHPAAGPRAWQGQPLGLLGTLALLPGVFLPSSAASSTTTCHGSSHPFGPGYCLLLVLHDDGLSCPAAAGEEGFFSPTMG